MSTLEYASLPDMQAWAESIMQREQDFVIGDRQLLRWWIIPRNEKLNVYLHAVLKSDEDRAMHDHPWANTSFLISGSYIEHTPAGIFVRQAGDVVERPAGAMHRLEVIPGERAISLFITGPKVREWGFDCGQGWVHWQDFVNRENQGAVGRGCGEQGDLSPVTAVGQPRSLVEA
jgi:quercetin dioxygenase-like cupin family protein